MKTQPISMRNVILTMICYRNLIKVTRKSFMYLDNNIPNTFHEQNFSKLKRFRYDHGFN